MFFHHNGKSTHVSHRRKQSPGRESNSANALTCCAPIINHSGPLRRIRWRGIGIPRAIWFLRPLATSDHRLHLSLDDKNSRVIADENYLMHLRIGNLTAAPGTCSWAHRDAVAYSMRLPVVQYQSGSGLSRMSFNVSCSTYSLKSPDRIADVKKPRHFC